MAVKSFSARGSGQSAGALAEPAPGAARSADAGEDAGGADSGGAGDAGPIRLETFLPYRVTALADVIARRTAATARRHKGMNLSRWRVLAAVAEAPGRTANAVVAVTPMDKGVVSRAVKALIGLGLLDRRASDADGRLGRLFLTPRGERVYAAMAAEIRAHDRTLRAGLTPAETDELGRLLGKVAAAARRSEAAG